MTESKEQELANLERLLSKDDVALARACFPPLTGNALIGFAGQGFTQARMSSFLDSAQQGHDLALHALAYVLANQGDFDRAGQVLRAYLERCRASLMQRHLAKLKRKIALLNANAAKHEEQIDRLTAVWTRGLVLRESERGWPVSNVKFAQRLADELGIPANSIRKELPALELDAKLWKEKIRAKNRVKDGAAKNSNKIARRVKNLRRTKK